VPENLAGRAISLLPLKRLGVPVGLTNEGGGFERNIRDSVVVEHQHQQEMHLHRGQQPGGRMAPGTMFQKTGQDILLGLQSRSGLHCPSHWMPQAASEIVNPAGPEEPTSATVNIKQMPL